MNWTEIAERAEKAKHPDRVLDAATFVALGYLQNPKNPEFVKVPSDDIYHRCACLTTSVDRMLALIGSEMKGILDIQFTYEPDAPEVWPAATIRWYPPGRSGKDWNAQVAGAKTIPLALLAAFAKARAMAVQEE